MGIKEKLTKVKESKFFKFLAQYLKVCIPYGLVLNFIAFSVFGLPFTWYSFLGYGMLWYFLNTDIYEIFINSIRVFGVSITR